MNIIFVVSDTFRRDSLSCYWPTLVKTLLFPRVKRGREYFESCLTESGDLANAQL